MKEFRKKAFSEFSKNVTGLDGDVIVAAVWGVDESSRMAKTDVLAAVYHYLHIENDCSSTTRLQSYVDDLYKITDFSELGKTIDELQKYGSGVEKLIVYFEPTAEGVLSYLRQYESGNENLSLDDFLGMDEEEYGIDYKGMARELEALVNAPAVDKTVSGPEDTSGSQSDSEVDSMTKEERTAAVSKLSRADPVQDYD